MKITEKVHAIKHSFSIPASPELKLERFVFSFVLFGQERVYLVDSGVADSAKTILNNSIMQSDERLQIMPTCYRNRYMLLVDKFTIYWKI